MYLLTSILIIGTIYFQKTEPFLLLAAFSVYSFANSLFMFPAMHKFYYPAQDIYTFEHADGVGRATDLVIQPFVRFITLSFFPVVIGSGILYSLVSESKYAYCVFIILFCKYIPCRIQFH